MTRPDDAAGRGGVLLGAAVSEVAPVKWCSSCKANRAAGEFLAFADRTIKVKFCNPCAQRRMRGYWNMRNAVTDPAQIARDARE